MYRRRFLGLLCEAAAIAPLVFHIRTSAAVTDNTMISRETLSAFLDVLIPKDETPAASELGIHTKIILHAYSVENYIPLLKLGMDWLDNQSQISFSKNYKELGKKEQEKLAYIASSQEAPSVVQLFFDRIKNDAFFMYYTQPDSWKGMIGSPPQPYGYPDFQEIG